MRRRHTKPTCNIHLNVRVYGMSRVNFPPVRALVKTWKSDVDRLRSILACICIPIHVNQGCIELVHCNVLIEMSSYSAYAVNILRS